MAARACLEGKVAVVTGASRGLGRAIAVELARQGAAVVVNYRAQAEAAAEVVAAIEASGGRAIPVRADVSVAEQAQGLIDAALSAYARLDILVNNAGIARDNLLMRMSEDDWDAVLDTNLKSAFNCVKAAQRTLLRNRAGRIINVGSIVGLRGNAGQANYAAAKAGLVGFTKAVAQELAPRNITCNLVAPGFVATEMTAKLAAEYVTAAIARIPLARIGQPEDVATAVAFLASDAAAYITGQVLCVDGGMAM